MTFQLDIAKANGFAELVAHIDAGEDVALTRDGEVLAIVKPSSVAPKRQRQLGLWDHLNLDLPDDLFIGPDPETLAAVDGPVFPDDDEAAA
jgi:antitoxin (DNA-binding transcriptional repressor) of toxin-antitoxin stability system